VRVIRFDIFKSEISGRYECNIKNGFFRDFKYGVNKDKPLPTGEPIHTIVNEVYPEN
jgi:hypothetical protein